MRVILFEGQVFKSEDFTEISLEKNSYESCIFNSCNFTRASLRNAKFSTCTFLNCNFSLVKLDGCRFLQTQFVDCKIIGLEFFRCDKTFFSINIKKCLLQYCNFSELNMRESLFLESKIKECQFTNTILKGTNFTEVDLTGTLFHHCDLSGADFSSAIQYEINPLTNKLKKAKFSLPEAIGLLRGFDIILE